MGAEAHPIPNASVMAFFQAVEELLSAEGFVPPTDVYLASSCTEEWGGDGAPKIVAELQRRGIELFLVCDEGGAYHHRTHRRHPRQFCHGGRI